MPVIGGYLAFIGLYTGEAGLSLLTGVSVAGPGDWPKLCHLELLRLLLPGVAVGVALYLIRKARKTKIAIHTSVQRLHFSFH